MNYKRKFRRGALRYEETIISRLEIRCPFTHADLARKELYDKGYSIGRAGPLRLSLMKFSAVTYQVIGEKEVEL